MNLLILNTYDNQGGAAIATYRLHRGLRSIGTDSHLLVQIKKTDDPSVIGPTTRVQRLISALRPYLDMVVTKLYRNRRKELFSAAWLPDGLASRISKLGPDIVHLSWVAAGYFKIETLNELHQPIVWTLHDMWPFTGGCHYDDECGKFQESCGNCPILNSGRVDDLSRRIWERKQKSWDGVPIVAVAPSQWLANMARSSSLFKDKRVEVIPNGIDIEIFKPINKKDARAACNLPQEKHLILFSAISATTDKRKGSQFLIQALKKMTEEGWTSKVELVIVGASRPENPPNMGMKVHYMGHLHDEASQVMLYSAADVTVAPSMQENLSNTVMESLACGTPVVAFDIGGMPDMIEHQSNGYLATPYESNDLAGGIIWVLEDESRRDKLSRCARATVLERYALEKVANRYLDLYQSILK